MLIDPAGRAMPCHSAGVIPGLEFADAALRVLRSAVGSPSEKIRSSFLLCSEWRATVMTRAYAFGAAMMAPLLQRAISY